MSSFGKLVTRLGLIALFSAMPLAAQMGNGMKFTAPFPFHVGKALMPSGTYLLTQPEETTSRSPLSRVSTVYTPRPSRSIRPSLLRLRVNLKSSSRNMEILCTSTERSSKARPMG
jgi:hypothetical protein